MHSKAKLEVANSLMQMDQAGDMRKDSLMRDQKRPRGWRAQPQDRRISPWHSPSPSSSSGSVLWFLLLPATRVSNSYKPPLFNALRTPARVPAGFLKDLQLGNLSLCVIPHGTRGRLNHSCLVVEHAHVPLCSGTPGSSPDHRGLWAEQPLICLISGNPDFRAGSEPTQKKVPRLNPAKGAADTGRVTGAAWGACALEGG